MAKCLVSEFSTAQEDDQGRSIPVAKSELRTQAVTYTTATQSLAFKASCKFVRIIADAEVFLRFGSDPTADANSIRLPADTVEYFGVEQGAKVSCYDGTS